MILKPNEVNIATLIRMVFARCDKKPVDAKVLMTIGSIKLTSYIGMDNSYNIKTFLKLGLVEFAQGTKFVKWSGIKPTDENIRDLVLSFKAAHKKKRKKVVEPKQLNLPFKEETSKTFDEYMANGAQVTETVEPTNDAQTTDESQAYEQATVNVEPTRLDLVNSLRQCEIDVKKFKVAEDLARIALDEYDLKASMRK